MRIRESVSQPFCCALRSEHQNREIRTAARQYLHVSKIIPSLYVQDTRAVGARSTSRNIQSALGKFQVARQVDFVLKLVATSHVSSWK